MKKSLRLAAALAALALLAASLCGCVPALFFGAALANPGTWRLAREIYVVERAIPSGYSSCEELLDPAHDLPLAQDFCDYCKYRYEDDSAVRGVEFYAEVEAGDVAAIVGYFEDFEGWAKACDHLAAYDFDKSCVTPGDLFFIKSLEGEPIGDSEYGKYDNYSVYLFDTETNTLYYIHANI